jgi:tetratricopeptide (TPR) repeat protein
MPLPAIRPLSSCVQTSPLRTAIWVSNQRFVSVRVNDDAGDFAASCHYDLGNLKEAIRCLKYSIQLEPNFPDAHNNLGKFCVRICVLGLSIYFLLNR